MKSILELKICSIIIKCTLEASYVKTWAKNDQAKAKGIEIVNVSYNSLSKSFEAIKKFLDIIFSLKILEKIQFV